MKLVILVVDQNSFKIGIQNCEKLFVAAVITVDEKMS
jgi:hypothetical protein